MMGNLLNIIACAKFQNEIFRGYDFIVGRLFHLPSNFAWDSAALLLRYSRSTAHRETDKGISK